MKWKKYITTGLFTVCAGTLALGMASCGVFSSPSVEFENWQTTGTATASLGSIYKIEDTSIVDVNGNTHF